MLRSLFERIEALRQMLRCQRSGAIFRGQRIGPMLADGSRGWELCPQLYRCRPRSDSLESERNIYESFVSYAGTQIERGKSSWEILAEMQHHGAYTRLLDWSESLASAMYFAVAYQPHLERVRPCIWVANAFRLNAQAMRSCRRKEELGIPRTSNLPHTTVNFCVPGYPAFDYAEMIFDPEKDWPFRYPFVMESPYTNSRLRAQKGLFTVHGSDKAPLNETMKKHVGYVELSDVEQSAVGKLLRDMGLDHYSQFPDLDGLAKSLNERYFAT